MTKLEHEIAVAEDAEAEAQFAAQAAKAAAARATQEAKAALAEHAEAARAAARASDLAADTAQARAGTCRAATIKAWNSLLAPAHDAFSQLGDAIVRKPVGTIVHGGGRDLLDAEQDAKLAGLVLGHHQDTREQGFTLLF